MKGLVVEVSYDLIYILCIRTTHDETWEHNSTSEEALSESDVDFFQSDSEFESESCEKTPQRKIIKETYNIKVV